MSKVKSKKIESTCGWIGLLLVQGSVLPPTISMLMGDHSNCPPIHMIIMIQCGLLMYLVRGIIQRDIIHIISNSIGLVSQSFLLSLVVFA